jgi:hypothetical protein
MWDVVIDKNESVLGMHLCMNEAAWLKERNGWAICNFMFEDYYENDHMCSVCKEKIPKEILDFYDLCKAMEPSDSKSYISNILKRHRDNLLR